MPKIITVGLLHFKLETADSYVALLQSKLAPYDSTAVKEINKMNNDNSLFIPLPRNVPSTESHGELLP